jgi:ketosteroid isomerase-like protein
MSQENVEIVRGCVEAFSGVDFSRAYELLDPEIEIDLSRNIFNPHIYRGHAGAEQWRSGIEDVWEDLSGVAEELIDAGDKVVAAVAMQAKGKGSGAPVRTLFFSIWTLRDSKVVRVVGGYRDRSTALEAAGLPD